jgi:hypothetical protein
MVTNVSEKPAASVLKAEKPKDGDSKVKVKVKFLCPHHEGI